MSNNLLQIIFSLALPVSSASHQNVFFVRASDVFAFIEVKLNTLQYPNDSKRFIIENGINAMAYR